VVTKVASPGKCVGGFNGDGLGTAHGWLSTPIIPEQPLFPCPQFNDGEGACCNNVLANEIGMSYDHMFDVGGSGKGTPRSQECLFKARAKYKELNEYFCMACNPKQLGFMSCCDKLSSNTTQCLGNQTLYGNMKPNGQMCSARDVNTIRICKDYADAAWDKQRNPIDGSTFRPGEMYDQCGMLIWAPDQEADAPAKEPGAPNVLPWGDVAGSSGDDPVVPSATWTSFAAYSRDIKPPLFDEFNVLIVPDAEGGCFAGAKQYNAAGKVAVHAFTLVLVTFASALWLL
jgi:hypothetical protein